MRKFEPVYLMHLRDSSCCAVAMHREVMRYILTSSEQMGQSDRQMGSNAGVRGGGRTAEGSNRRWERH